MHTKRTDVIDETDLGTFLVTRAHALREKALALTGLAYENSEPGETDFGVLTTMAHLLEQAADGLEMAEGRLCQRCRLLDVVSSTRIGRRS